jgi:hypothetical protein
MAGPSSSETAVSGDRRLGLAVAIDLAREWAAQLVDHHGLTVVGARGLAARRYGVPIGEVQVEISRLARQWVGGSLARPTVRPARAVIEAEDNEAEEQTRGAA